MKRNHRIISNVASLLGVLALGAFGTTSAYADGSGVALYISAPEIQTAETSGLANSPTILTEDFNGRTDEDLTDGFTAGNGGFYTVSQTPANGEIKSNDIYGGVGQGDYLNITNPDKSVEISFNITTGVNYFGFLWTAGDASNKISLYTGVDGNELLVSYTTAHIMQLLNDAGTTLTAFDGTEYSASDYFSELSNPNEAYVYLHFFTGDTPITRIVLEKLDVETGGNFESDNHSTIAGALKDDLENLTPLVKIADNLPVPEPSAALLLLITGCLAAMRRRRNA